MKQTNKAIDISLRNHDNRSYLEIPCAGAAPESYLKTSCHNHSRLILQQSQSDFGPLISLAQH